VVKMMKRYSKDILSFDPSMAMKEDPQGDWCRWKDVESLETELAYLKDQFEKARTYKGIEAYPCPLCIYKDGILQNACVYHAKHVTQPPEDSDDD